MCALFLEEKNRKGMNTMREDIRTFLMPETPPPFFADMIGISYCDGSYLIR